MSNWSFRSGATCVFTNGRTDGIASWDHETCNVYVNLLQEKIASCCWGICISLTITVVRVPTVVVPVRNSQNYVDLRGGSKCLSLRHLNECTTSTRTCALILGIHLQTDETVFRTNLILGTCLILKSTFFNAVDQKVLTCLATTDNVNQRAVNSELLYLLYRTTKDAASSG